MSNKGKRGSYNPLLESNEALNMNPMEPSQKEPADKSKRNLRVSISVAVSSDRNEDAGAASSKPTEVDISCTTSCTPVRPARIVACCPLERPFNGDIENIGDAFAAGMLCGNGEPGQNNCPGCSRYPCDGFDEGLPPYTRGGYADEYLDHCSLDGCSLAGDTNSVDTFTDDWTDSVSNYVDSRCFVTRLVNCFCCLKPHDD